MEAKEMDKIFGKRLRELRLERKLTQRDVADKLGISDAAYRQYELGIRFPSLRTAIDIARVFGIGLDTLCNSIIRAS